MKQPSPVFGSLIVAIGALSLAGNNVFAVVSFEAGASPLTVITGRMIITLIALFLFMRSCGRQIALPSHDRKFALGLGVLNGLMAYCLLSAFDKIQVGLAILVFYFLSPSCWALCLDYRPRTVDPWAFAGIDWRICRLGYRSKSNS